MKRTKFVPFVLVCGMALVLAGIAPPAASAAPMVSTIETRLTTSLGDEYDPSISGDLVVYTSNRNINTDVFYYDLATSTEHQVTAAAGRQELADVWGTTIAYSDMAHWNVVLYDIATGQSTDLTADSLGVSLAPAVGDQVVAWEDRRYGKIDIYAMNMTTGEQRRVTDADYNLRPSVDGTQIVWDYNLRPSVDGTQIVWEKRQVVTGSGALSAICVYDWADNSTRQLTAFASPTSLDLALRFCARP